MKKTSKSILILVTLFFFLVFYIIHISEMIHSFLEYSEMFVQKIVPVSFPFYILSTLLLDYRFFDYFPFNSYSYYLFFLSMISGFPSGAKYIRELWDKHLINEVEGNTYLMFCHFPNPLFVLGTVSMVIPQKISIILLFSIILSNFILLLFSPKTKISQHHVENDPIFSKALGKAIYSSSKTILLVYGISTFFYLLSIFLLHFLSFSSYFTVFFYGVFDLSKGVFASSIFSSSFLRSLYILFFISFGGISIHMQTKSILSDTPFSYHSYLKGRFLGTILSFFFFLLFFFLTGYFNR